MIDRVKRLVARNRVFYDITCIGFCLYGVFNSFLFILMRLFPIKKNKIVCCNMKGKRYGDNPKYIVDEIVRRKLNYEIVWLMKDGFVAELPDGIRMAKYSLLSCAYELATAKFWIDSNTKLIGTLKRKNQYYIQTWHGSYGLKKIYGDISGKISFFDRRSVEYNSGIQDLLLSNSKMTTEIYRRAFWYEGQMLECGSPRNDLFFEEPEEYVRKVKAYFGLKDEKLVLYAPTYRDDFRIKDMRLDFERLRTALQRRFDGEWVVLVRLHPNNISDAEKFISYTNHILNATDYPVMQELLAACEVLVSDYSSCMFDFVTKKAPCFMYATDVERYKGERDFYFNVYELPFPLAENNDELQRNIMEFDEEKYARDLQTLFATVDLYDKGDACKQVVDWIVDHT